MKTLLSASKIATYLNECIALFDLVEGVKTIGDFVSRVELLADAKYPTAQLDDTELDKLNTFKGDMLEVFTEIFFYLFSNDPTVGLAGYTPVSISDDYGVDGIGINVNGDECAVQVKYRNNPVAVIEWSDMAKTFGAGICSHQLLLNKNDTVFLITTGEGVTGPCHQVLGNRLRVINRRIIAGKVDNNQNFWQEAQELILDTWDSLQ